MLKLIGFAAETILGTAAGKIAEVMGAPPTGQKAAKIATEYAVRKVLSKIS